MLFQWKKIGEKFPGKRKLIGKTKKAITAIAENKYMLKVNDRNIEKMCKICSKLTLKTTERRQWLCSRFFIVNFEHISHLFLVFLFLTSNKFTFAEIAITMMNILMFEILEMLESIVINGSFSTK